MSASVTEQPTATFSRKLPPCERDFEIYEAVHLAGCSTWSQADKHEISQTRVRQIICRVVEWLGEVLPPQAKVAKEQEVHLARQIAAGRFQRQYEDATTLWNETHQSKYASIRLRLTTAQARLGVVGGRLEGLAADAIEGIPVPTWQPPAETSSEDATSTSSNPKSKTQDLKSVPYDELPTDRARRQRRAELPPALYDPLFYNELTPEIVAARAFYGYPLSPFLIEYAKQHSPVWPRPDTSSSPPVEDFSAPSQNAATGQPASAATEFETRDAPTACAAAPQPADDAPAPPTAPSQPLLNTHSLPPVTEVQIAPDRPGALFSARS